MPKQKTYYIVPAIITEKDIIKEQQNAINFLNRGTNTVLINNLPLLAGEQLEISDETGAVDITKYSINFLNAGGTNRLIVIRKIYNTEL